MIDNIIPILLNGPINATKQTFVQNISPYSLLHYLQLKIDRDRLVTIKLQKI